MKSIIYILTGIFALLRSEDAISQNLPQIIPPSPVTREFNKYINYEVSMYNGLPDISIPLYTIQIKGVAIPVSLSYHGSGIKFKQDDGDVGVGWSLNPGYRISRTIYGFADELFSMPSYIFDSLAYYNGDNVKKDKYLSRYTSSGATDRPSSFNSQLLDGEYDQFNYNIAGAGGTFIINDRINKKITTLEKSNLKVEYNTGYNSATQATGILGLGITDESGVKYYMGNQLSAANNWVYETTSTSGGLVATAWALTDIINPGGEQVHFKYDKGTDGGYISHQLNFSVSEAVGIDPGTFITSNISTPEGHDGTYTTFLLSEITGVNDKVELTRQTGTNLVSTLEVRTVSNTLIKKVNFHYGVTAGHQFLESIEIQDKDTQTIETYKFDYYGMDANADFYGHDQWGYHQGFFTNPMVHLFHQDFSTDPINVADNASGPLTPETLNNLFSQYADRSNVTATPDVFSLQRITYPTGGSTEYEYESNRYDAGGGQIKNGGGLRIKTIRAYTAPGVPAFVRSYVYGKNENGYGNAPVLFSKNIFAAENLALKADPTHGFDGHTYYPERIINYSTDVQGDIDPGGFLSSYVVYPFVTEYYGTNTINANTGKITYKYDLQFQFLANRLSYSAPTPIPNSEYAAYSPLYVNRYETWKKPLLTEKSTYLNQGVQYQIVKREQFIYSGGFAEFNGLKVKPFATADYYNVTGTSYYNYLSSFFEYGMYTVESGEDLLMEKDEKLFAAGDSITARTTYQYNALNQLSKETLYDSKGGSIQSLNNYPYDMIAAGHDPGGIYQGMVTSNILSPVIEKIRSKNSVQLSLNRTNYYHPYTNLYVPQTIETQNAIADPAETRIRFSGYDIAGNVLNVSKEAGPQICYVYSYNGQYPVAMIENASYSTVVSVLGGQANVDNFRNNAAPTDAAVKSFLLPLRTNTALKDAFVTTYTYAPLTGVTSITDAKGEVTYYEYDSFQRLINIKDKDGNIVKHTDYHYNGQ